MTKTRQWTIFTAIAVIVVLLAGWFLLVKPQSTKASTLRSEAASQNASNALIQTQITSLQAEQRQLPEQQKQLQKFATQVPADASEPAVIRQLSAAAAGSGVNLVSLTPGSATAVAVSGAAPGSTTLVAPSTSGQLVQLPVTLAILGSYPNVESFFLSLEKLPRALLVTGWSLCPTNSSGGATSAVACTPPAAPSNFTPPPGVNELGGTISAMVFYAPPAGVTAPAATLPAATATTAPTTAASTPASSTPTVASSAPAN